MVLGNWILLLVVSADSQTWWAVSLCALYSRTCVHLQQGNPSHPERTSCPFKTALCLFLPGALGGPVQWSLSLDRTNFYINFSTYRYLAQADGILAFNKLPSLFVNKVLLKCTHAHLLTYCQQQLFFSKGRVEELQQRLYGPQVDNLLSGPVQRMLVNLWYKFKSWTRVRAGRRLQSLRGETNFFHSESKLTSFFVHSRC